MRVKIYMYCYNKQLYPDSQGAGVKRRAGAETNRSLVNGCMIFPVWMRKICIIKSRLIEYDILKKMRREWKLCARLWRI